MKQNIVARFSVLALALTFIGAGAASAEDTNYKLEKTAPKVTVGAKSTATVTIAARNGWHLNAEAPFSLSLVAPSGVTLAKPKMGRGDLAKSSQDSAEFNVGFEASDPGTKTVTGEARFVLCQESACKPVKETVSINIEVTAPTAAPTPPTKATKRAKKS